MIKWAVFALILGLTGAEEDWTDWDKSPNSTLCYVTNNQTKEHWVLKWQDEFAGDLSAKWSVDHETKFCSGNNVDDASCSIKSNAYTLPRGPDNGVLLLQAKHGDYYTRKFTGARITSQYLFPLDSTPYNVIIEVRAALPVGAQLYASIFAMNSKEVDPYDFHYGWLELVTNYQRRHILHGAHYRKPNLLGHILKEYEHVDLSQFQTYRVHWNGSSIHFSVNENVTEPLDRASSDPAEYRLVMLIGVGGSHFHQPLPTDFDQLNWMCPALIVDYVRVYEQQDNVYNLPQCNFSPPIDNAQIGSLCELALEATLGHEPNDESEVSLTVLVIGAVVFAGIILLILYVLAKSGKLGSAAARVGTYRRNEEFLFEYNNNRDVSATTNSAFDSGLMNGRAG